jgi:hypothetical protein
MVNGEWEELSPFTVDHLLSISFLAFSKFSDKSENLDMACPQDFHLSAD